MKPTNTNEMKEEVRVSFDQIVQKCSTVGELQKLNEEVKKLNKDMDHFRRLK